MSPAELARQVRLLEISTRHTVTEVFAGEYTSAFKGRGMEFAEVREYQPGDDVRTIDWNVTARTGKPYVKRFTEERELTVLLVVDLSASGDFGTQAKSKRQLAVEASAVRIERRSFHCPSTGRCGAARAPASSASHDSGRGNALPPQCARP